MRRKELRQIIEAAGFELVRGKKHFVFKNKDGKTIIMPNHNRLDKHTVKSIMKLIEVQ